MTRLVWRAVQAQDQIGWKNFIEGLPAKQWKAAQSRYYQLNAITSKSTNRWMRGLLRKLHELGHGQWQHRNDTLYHPQMKKQNEAVAMLHQEILTEYARGRCDLPPRDQGHFSHSLLVLLNKSTEYLQCWLINVTSARDRQA